MTKAKTPEQIEELMSKIATQVRLNEPDIISIQRQTASLWNTISEFLYSTNRRDYGIRFDESDKRLTAMFEIDINKIQLVAMHKENDATTVSGDTLLTRLKFNHAEYIRLDAYVLLSMMKNQLRISKKWEEWCEADASRVILFGGTVLEDGDRARYSLGLHFQNGRWEVDEYPLLHNYSNDQVLFAVLFAVLSE